MSKVGKANTERFRRLVPGLRRLGPGLPLTWVTSAGRDRAMGAGLVAGLREAVCTQDECTGREGSDLNKRKVTHRYSHYQSRPDARPNGSPALSSTTSGQCVTVTTILPIWVLDSIYRWAATISSRSKVRSTTGWKAPVRRPEATNASARRSRRSSVVISNRV